MQPHRMYLKTPLTQRHVLVLIDIHKAYFDAGSNIVSSNTFGVNALVYSESEMKELIEKAGIFIEMPNFS